ncbi:SDR family oxidoreductase [Sporichthya brevicatena]|uniref:SDR family oxidoreductase n=1 Tax=Sporichthya brevicatena TaxID=171442 RepID=A0ABN1G9J1_9ACTN
MRIFVTGASGWIGVPTVTRLLAAGHEVVGLARSDAAAAAIPAGAEVVRGSLDDLDLLHAQAADSDGVVHLAFRHDIAFAGDFTGAVVSDRRAIDAFGDALKGSDKPFVLASGVLGLPGGRVITEDDRPDPAVHPRYANAAVTLDLAANAVRSVVVRFAPTVHGAGDHGFVAALVGIAQQTGVSGYLGDGTNRWPAVHVSDAADLVHRALERAPAGSVVHAMAEVGVPTRDIAEAIGRQLGVPARSIPPEQAAHFGFLAELFGMDAPTSSEITRRELGWNPSGPTLLEDLNVGAYSPR